MSEVKKVKRKAGRPKEQSSLNTDDILRVALKSFAQKGYGGVTLNALAKKTGVADSLLHYHFGSKEELWKRSMKLVGDLIYRELDNLFRLINDLDGLEKLRLYNKKIVQVSAEFPEFQQVVVQEVFSDSPRSAWLIETLLQPTFQFMEDILVKEKNAGRIKNISAPTLNSFIIGAITTLFSRSFQMKIMYNVNPFDADIVDQHADDINDLLFYGLLKD